MIRRLAPATLGVLVLLLACTDLIGPRGGDSVRLVVQPSFGQVPATAAADNPASRVDNVHMVLKNAAGTTVLDTIIEWPLDQDTLRMEMDVVVQEQETFELTIEGRSGDRVLFKAGPTSLELSEDDEGSTVATSPVLEYAGPGAEVAAVEITGAPAAFVAGRTVGLGAAGTNEDGSDAGDLIIIWTSLDPAAATVDDEGRVQTGHDALRAVSIEARVAFTTISDTVGGPVHPAELSLSPDASTLTALGAALSLTAALLGEDGGDVTGVPVEWSVADPSVLELASEGDGAGSAVATALARGTTRVFATAGELSDSADVTVEQTVARVEVEPDSAALARVDTTLQATATAFDANDNEVEDAAVTWSSGDPDVATVAEDGTITAVSPGSAPIIATSEEASDSLLATVANSAPELAITAPADGATFEEGDIITFEGAAEDLEDGDLSASVAWVSDNPGELGTGASVAAELEPGDHTVTATVVDAHGDTASASIQVTVNANTAPTVSITAPSEAITVRYGAEVTLEGAADDEQDGDLSGSIEWSSDLDGELGTGASVAATGLRIAAHTITAAVTDSHGETAIASVRVDVALPNLTIGELTIEAAEPLGPDDTVRITIEVLNDAGVESDSAGAAVRALDGDTEAVLGEVTFTIPPLAARESVVRVLEVSEEDAADQDLVGDSIFFEIELDPDHTVSESDETDNVVRSPAFAVDDDTAGPTVSITAPATGTIVEHGTEVELRGIAEDVDDGDLSDSIQWSTSEPVHLGSGRSLNVTLEAGVHTITAAVADRHGNIAAMSIELTVRSNTAPVVTITAPESGTSVAEGTSVGFTGTAEDTQEGDLSDSVQWTSSRDGPLGQGASITVNDLSVGTHDIDATATDSHGATGRSRISLAVAAGDPEVSGTVFYSTGGVPGATVDLVQGETPEGTAVYTTTSDTQGAFVFPAVVSGEYWLRVGGPSDEFMTSVAYGITVGSSDQIEDVDLPKKIALASPADQAVVSVLPTLQWTAIDEAVSYTVQLNVSDTWSEVARVEGIEDTSYGVGSTLTEEELYTWQVDAYDLDGHHVGSTEELFTFMFATPPAVTITLDTGLSVIYGRDVTYTAGVDDPEDEDLTVQWTVSNEALGFGTGLGAVLQTNQLTLGTHTIEAKVTNARTGLHGTATHQLEVEPPGLTITAPTHNALLVDNVKHTFRAGLVKANELGEDSVNVPATRWSYEQDGTETPFPDDPQGFEVQQALEIGTYRIIARIANASNSTVTTDTISVTVAQGPTLNVTSPAEGAELSATGVLLSATATDAAGLDITTEIEWEVDGTVYTGGEHTLTDLLSGEYTITISVTDNDGLTTTETRTFTINST